MKVDINYEALEWQIVECPLVVTDVPVMWVASVPDEFVNGGHHYKLANMCGVDPETGKTKTDGTYQYFSFLYKDSKGGFKSGVISEQIFSMMLNRTKKLNEMFPSLHNELVIDGLEIASKSTILRTKDRINRAVIGQHKV